MRILHSIRSVNPLGGGPVEAVKQFAAAHARAGHEVEVVSLDAPGAAWVREFPLACHALGPGRGGYGYSARFAPWLREHASEYDAVVIDGIWQYNAFGVWRALAGGGRNGGGTPYFVFTHGMLDPWFKRTYPLKHFKKMLYWPWGDYRVLRDAKAVLFTCEEERRLARRTFRLYSANERVVSFGTGAPPAKSAEEERAEMRAFQERFPGTKGKRCVLFLGRVHEKKGVDLLLRAFASELAAKGREPWHLIVAGPHEHDYGRAMQALARELKIVPRITWTGMISGGVKWGAFRSAEVFALPSHQENFGISVVEAMACGVPVLISDKVNIWREIADDGAGFVDGDDLDGTRRLLARWAAATAGERAGLGGRAWESFEKRFDIEQAARNLREVLGR